MNTQTQSVIEQNTEKLIDLNILEQINILYDKPLLELIFEAQTIHRQFHDFSKIQFCTLSSIKTGACPENCHYFFHFYYTDIDT